MCPLNAFPQNGFSKSVLLQNMAFSKPVLQHGGKLVAETRVRPDAFINKPIIKRSKLSELPVILFLLCLACADTAQHAQH